MAAPYATYVFGVLGTLFLVRGLWNPHRALTHSASLAACPGPDAGTCQNTIALAAEPDTAVYSAVAGTVLAVGDRWVLVQASNETVVVGYYGVTPDVVQGQHVGSGRKIGLTRSDGPLEFGVTQIDGMVPVEPRSWLAARGITLTVKRMPDVDSDRWCGPSRHITVPAAVHQGCQLQNPSQAGFALLPVSITQA